ncbi:ATP-dependent zinc protease family protein [Algoriphagus namhaensis]
MADKKIIGRREKIALPELAEGLVWAKVDTGAYTSSLHASEVRVEIENGEEVLRFIPFDPKNKIYKGQTLSFKKFRKKLVKNSFGEGEDRYLIETTLRLAGEEYQAELTLSDRTKMRNSILLGRKALKKRFLVDVDRTNLGKTQ